MGSLFSELKRRKVFRVTAAYLVGAWAILEFVSVVSPMLRLPDWIGPFVLILLAIGLVAAVAVSWTFEVTADGLRRTEPDSLPTGTGNTKLDWALMVASVAIIALVSYQQIFARTGGLGEPSVVSNATPGTISIAVLPFVNLSSDPEQEFFSDGMTEEITSALAKVRGLQVVGRTSAFEFKGQNKDLNAIGKALRASHLLEGSVRKSGNRVRITGQLIRADNGTHMWTENYDRELTDIFKTQDDIAQAIASALQVPLGLKAGETLVPNRTGDAGAYEDFLRAKALFRSRRLGAPLTAPIALLEQVVERQPDYAPAWGLLAQVRSLATIYDPAYYKVSTAELRRVSDANMQQAEAAAHQAIRLEPGNAEAHGALGHVQVSRGDRLEAERSYKQALSHDPLNPDVLHLYSAFLAVSGRIDDAVLIRAQLRALEPLPPVFNSGTSLILLIAGDVTGALDLGKAASSFNAGIFAAIYAEMGRYKEAADAALSLPSDLYEPGAVEAAARLLRMAPAPAPQQGIPYLGDLSWVFAYVSAPERALEWNEHLADVGHPMSGPAHAQIWQPAFRTVRKTERFKALVRKLGLVDYWRARGWPDVCRPVGADDFECD